MATTMDGKTDHALSKPVTSEFAVAMECNHCVDSVRNELSKNANISNIDISLPDQRVVITSTTPPSHLYSTLKNLGRTVVFRGVTSGTQRRPSSSANAGVCIFEHFPGVGTGWAQYDNKGLARLVQVDDDDDNTMMIDVTLEGLKPSTQHSINIRECGDISQGCSSTGGIYKHIGTMDTDEKGRGDLVTEVRHLQLWDVVGRSLVVEPSSRLDANKANEESICGIIARSAGLFENVKRVCSCSGKTLWEESARI